MEVILLCDLLVKFLFPKQRHSIGTTKAGTKIHLAVDDVLHTFLQPEGNRFALHQRQTHLESSRIYQQLSNSADFKLCHILSRMDVLSRTCNTNQG